MNVIAPNAELESPATSVRQDGTARHGVRDEAPQPVATQAYGKVSVSSTSNSFASLAAMIPGVVYQRIVTPAGQIYYTYISEGAADLFGLSPSEIVENPEALFSSYSPEYRAEFREKLIEASRKLTIWDVEASFVRPDGSRRYTHAIARPSLNPDGSVLWTGVILDATRIKDAEARATETESRTRGVIVESLSQGFLMYDPDDRLVIRNSHLLALYPFLENVAQPGTSYEEIVRAELGSGDVLAAETPDREAAIAARLAGHALSKAVYQYQLGPDHYIMVTEHRDADGGTTVLYTDISELKRREREIQRLALHDALTGLPNRLLFQERIHEALQITRRSSLPCSVLCLDLDNFKGVNDTFGHPAGDRLLEAVAARVRGCLRPNDTAARLGGDEFAIIIPDLPSNEFAEALAWRILTAVSEPIAIDGRAIYSGASIGIAVSTTDGHDPDTLLRNADLALYRAKTEGRGTFRFFEEEMDSSAQRRRALQADLRRAVHNNELVLHYQPLVTVNTGEISGFEALVRWNHPTIGMIPPDEFISLAEESGTILTLGEWVLRRACTDAVAWPLNVKVAVNLSPAQFRSRDLCATVKEVLTETGFPAARLQLEVTESLLLRDSEANLATLHRLRNLGVGISMDDFGTGYSSLSNLRSFPFDKIKVDRSFVAEVRQPGSAAIINAVLSLGHDLGMKTTVEGVETYDQLSRLCALGCSEVQGFLYSRPVVNGSAIDLLNGAAFPIPDARRGTSSPTGRKARPA